MQLQSTLTRLAAFAFFLLSFSMLVSAAPTTVAAPGAGELAARDSSLVARTDYTSQCNDHLVALKADVIVKVDTLVTCSKTLGCNTAPVLADITLLIRVFIDKIKAQVALGATVDVNVVIGLWIEIVVYILAQLRVCVGLTVALCADLVVVLFAYVQLCLALCANIVLKTAILLKIKVAVAVYIDVCLKYGFNPLLSILGLL